MPPRAQPRCARCGKPVAPSAPQVRTYGKRWHQECWPAQSRLGRTPRAGEAANTEVRVPLTTAERDRWRAAANEAGHPLTQYIRTAVERQISVDESVDRRDRGVVSD